MGAYLSSPITTKVSGENNQGRDRRAREKTETNDGHGRRQCSQAATHISLSLPFSLSLLPSHFTLRKTGDARRRVRGLCVRRLGDAGLAHGDGKKRKRGEIKRGTEAFALLHRGRGKKGARRRPSPRLSFSRALLSHSLPPHPPLTIPSSHFRPAGAGRQRGGGVAGGGSPPRPLSRAAP